MLKNKKRGFVQGSDRGKVIAVCCATGIINLSLLGVSNVANAMEQDIEFDVIESIATPSNVVLATPSNIITHDTPKIEEEQIAIQPDGFYSNGPGTLFYRKNGETIKNEWIEEFDTLYYAGDNGALASGWKEIDGVWYFFSISCSLKTGWIYDDNTWYYCTENGMLTGYQTIDEKDFYFNEDGSLAVGCTVSDGRMADQDGYLYDPSVVYPSFSYTKSSTDTLGTISGLNIAGMPAEFYMLSIAGETSGGQIIMGDRGRAYGLCQLDYRYDLVGFIRWAYNKHPDLWKEFSSFTKYSNGDTTLIGNIDLSEAFRSAMERSYEGAVTDQLDYMRERYWDSFSKKLNDAGFNLSGRHIAVSAALLSVNINCGQQADIFINNLSPCMTDAEMICKIYEIRNTILANQHVGSSIKGTTTRYRYSEPEMALDLLYGYTTIDTVRSYGGGVEWHGNIFTGTVLTAGIKGRSADWQQYLAAHQVETKAVEETTVAETEATVTVEKSTEEVVETTTSQIVEYGPGAEISAAESEEETTAASEETTHEG